MKRSTAILVAVAIVAGTGLAWWWLTPPPEEEAPLLPVVKGPSQPGAGGRLGELLRPPRERIRAPQDLSPQEKWNLIAKIKRDYDEIRAKASADYTAAAATFPGGINAFLRQLALLERERRQDYAAILTPRELEDLEARETNAGQLVQRLLADTSATEEQRRAVFRAQLEFEDRFALTFDTAPSALLERERARCETQERILAVLGDALFPAWLRGEGPDFGHYSTFVAQHGLPPSSALDLWRAKNEFVLRQLEINTQSNLTAEQARAAHLEVIRDSRARVASILGPGAMQAASHEVLGWLPRK